MGLEWALDLYQHSIQTSRSGDRTYKLGSGTTSEYGRYVKSLGEPCRGLGHGGHDLSTPEHETHSSSTDHSH